MPKQNDNNNMMQYMANPRAYTLKRWLVQILQERFSQHETIIERMGAAMTAENDLKAFGSLVGDLFQVGYMKAVNDYREQFEKLGVKINVVAAEQPNP